MEDKSRHWGIDLARVVSTYGVVLIHSGGYAPFDLLSIKIFNFFGFALPFSVGFSMNYVQFYSVFYLIEVADIYPVAKFVLLEAWFIAICLPYIFFARIIHEWKDKSSLFLSRRNYLMLVLLFIIVITLGRSLLPFFINEPVFGCLLLTIAINFPSSLLNSFSKKILLDLSNASFGIYLLHHLIVNLFETIVTKFNPDFMSQVSVVSQILFSTSGFLISWSIVRIFTNKEELIISQ